MKTEPRGSRKHVLDWIGHPGFVDQLNMLLYAGVIVDSERDHWMPTANDDTEARLDKPRGKHLLPDPAIGDHLAEWWLVHRRGANTPNWDMASICRINDTPGIVLVEAKANVPELTVSGKALSRPDNEHSRANHARIGEAIEEARTYLDRLIPGVCISRDSHYQLSNRVAFAWKLASFGVPVVLMYLGFIGDEGIRDAGEPFESEAHWQQHVRAVLPEGFAERDIPCGKAGFRMIVRARPVLEVSSPKEE